jgi:hypothetical protein
MLPAVNEGLKLHVNENCDQKVKIGAIIILPASAFSYHMVSNNVNQQLPGSKCKKFAF